MDGNYVMAIVSGSQKRPIVFHRHFDMPKNNGYHYNSNNTSAHIAFDVFEHIPLNCATVSLNSLG